MYFTFHFILTALNLYIRHTTTLLHFRVIMRFITTALQYLIVINSLISTGFAAHHFPCGASVIKRNAVLNRVISPRNIQRFAKATHLLALNKLIKTPEIFQHLCNHAFLQQVPLGLLEPQWAPYVPDAHNSFLEFIQHPNPHDLSTELQITSSSVWLDNSMVAPAPSSDASHNTFIYNLITDLECDSDRILVFNNQNHTHTQKIIRVVQMGLGSDRLQNSKDPETKAWLEFLTQAHLMQDIPRQTPDNVAIAYSALDLNHWSAEATAYYYNSLIPHSPLTQKELTDIIAIIDLCLDKNYPIANMVKYTGLCPTEIKTLIDQLNHSQRQ